MDAMLNKLRLEVQGWEKLKKKEAREELEQIDSKIQSLPNSVDELHLLTDMKEQLQVLETKTGVLLRQK